MKNTISFRITSLFLLLPFLFLTSCLSPEASDQTQTNAPQSKDESPTDPDSAPAITTSTLQHARIMHQAIKLNDGRVFVVGGAETSEIYDPTTNTWSSGPTASGFCTTGDFVAQAVLLNDGRVLAICGYQTNIYIFDLALNTVNVVGQLSHSRNGASLTKLTTGEVLIVGGVHETSYLTAHRYRDAEIFNPTNNSLRTPLNQLTYGKATHSAIMDNTGKVFLFGGHSYQQQGTNFEIFQPWSAFNAVGGIYQNRYHAHPFLLPSGNILLVGGMVFDNTGHSIASLLVEEYGSHTGEKNPLPRGFYESAAAQLADGTPILVGGDDVSNSVARKEIYIYNFATETFELKGSMLKNRKKHTATLLDNGDLLIVGGIGQNGDSETSTSAERIPASIYNP